jgi:hypothetical protein
MTDHLRQRETTVVAPAWWVRVLPWIGLPLVGAGAVWLLKLVASWAPLQEIFWPAAYVDEVIASVGEPWSTIVVVFLGATAGLLFALYEPWTEGLILTVSVSDERVTIALQGQSSREIERDAVSAVFRDGDELVLLGQASEELLREDAGLLDADRLKEAFLAHGFPWRAGDPYKDEYSLWVEDTPDLPPGDNALLKARALALARGDEGKDDAQAIRVELSKLGIVVRDEEGELQYWRYSGDRRSG